MTDLRLDRLLTLAFCLGTTVAAGLLPAQAKPPESAAVQAAKAYATNCVGCHDEDGRGRGNLSQPGNWHELGAVDSGRKPRDFTREYFRYGDSKAEIIKTIQRGSHDTAMDTFREMYPPAVIAALADLVLNYRRPLSNAVIRAKYPERVPRDLQKKPAAR